MPPAAGSLLVDMTVDRRGFDVRVSLAVAAGECVAVLGPSGAGKSTVLAAVAGLVPLRAGTVWLDGQLLSAPGKPAVVLRARRVGLLAQRPALFPHLDGAANIGYSLPGGGAHPLVRHLADVVEVADVLGARPARMSGGQRQRVALARVLAADPRALLLDEPFSALERELRDRIARWVVDEVRRRQVPCLLVTHDVAEAQRCGRRIAVLDGGRCLQVAAPGTLVRAPASRRVAELVGYQAFVPVDFGRPTGNWALPPGAGSCVVGIHPDLVQALPQPAEAGGLEMHGTIGSLVASGATVDASVALADGSTFGVRLGAGQPVPSLGSSIDVLVYQPPCFDTRGDLVPGTGPPSDAGSLAQPVGMP
jgi:thiamine transport system ATP-binding protein